MNACPPDTEDLYYPLDVESVTLKDSLLPALKAPEHEYIFSKYSQNSNISGILSMLHEE